MKLAGKALKRIAALWVVWLFILFVLAILLLVFKGECDNDGDHKDLVCDLSEAIFLLFTTFHGNTWGHMVPHTTGQRALCALVAILGYLFPFAACAICLHVANAKKQLRYALLSFSITYLVIGLGGSLAFAAIQQNSWTESQHIKPPGFDVSLYYVLGTYHQRAYGDFVPENGISDLIAVLLSVLSLAPPLAGLLVVVAATVARSNMLRTLGRVLSQIGGLWLACFIVQLVLAGVSFRFALPERCSEDEIHPWVSLDDEIYGFCDFGNTLFVLFTTFHGITWGHFVPENGMQRVACVIVSILGYLFLPLVFAIGLKEVGSIIQYNTYRWWFSSSYLLLGGVGTLIAAFVNNSAISAQRNASIMIASTEQIGIDMSWYYVLMTFHHRCYGELYPDTGADECIAFLCSVLSMAPLLLGGLFALERTEAIPAVQAVVSLPQVVLGQVVDISAPTKPCNVKSALARKSKEHNPQQV